MSIHQETLPDLLGIDLGGTDIKMGRFSSCGELQQSLTLKTPHPATPAAVVEALEMGVKTLDPDHRAGALGVGVPGAVNRAGRIVRGAINLQGWRDVPLADQLEALTQYPTTLANDANCAGLGEAWRGAGRDYQNFLLLTLGTGVGGAVILEGQLFVGPQGAGAELGLITLRPEGPPCNSGNRGSLEQFVSATAIHRDTGLEAKVWGERAAAGDLQAREFWRAYGQNLGIGLTSLIYIFTPEAIILGGGVAQSLEFFLPAVWGEIEQRVLPSSRAGLKIITASLGNSAGRVGAAKLARDLLLLGTPKAA